MMGPIVGRGSGWRGIVPVGIVSRGGLALWLRPGLVLLLVTSGTIDTTI